MLRVKDRQQEVRDVRRGGDGGDKIGLCFRRSFWLQCRK